MQPIYSFSLPWPKSELSPNSRIHWAQLAKAKRSYRQACWSAAINQGVRRVQADRLHLHLEFVPPNRRKFDLDNLLARMKAGLDGLADVLGVDDSRWSIRMERSCAPVPPGFVLVTVTRVFVREQEFFEAWKDNQMLGSVEAGENRREAWKQAIAICEKASSST